LLKTPELSATVIAAATAVTVAKELWRAAGNRKLEN
jgi:hypothetical protein